jgi:hypothetical protein
LFFSPLKIVYAHISMLNGHNKGANLAVFLHCLKCPKNPNIFNPNLAVVLPAWNPTMTDASEKPPNQSRRCRRSAPDPIGQARVFFVLRRQPFSCTLLALRSNLSGQITTSVILAVVLSVAMKVKKEKRNWSARTN